MTHKQHTEKSICSAPKTTQLGAFAYIFNRCTWNDTSHAHKQHTHTHAYKQPTKTRNCAGMTQRRSAGTSLYLQHRHILPHATQHKGPTSGNANSPLKPKPIRSLMQTCRAPLSFISPFNVRGLESDSITHPKEKKEKGKREIYHGVPNHPHVFKSS